MASPPTFRLEMTVTPGAVTTMFWRTNTKYGYGRPNAKNLAAYVSKFEEASLPGGVNAHIGSIKVVSARIVRQKTNEVVATYASD